MLLSEETVSEGEVIAYCDSSNLPCLKYNSNTKTLTIVFGKGQMYEYADVPRWQYLRLRDADSQGKKFNELIKNSGKGKELYAEKKTGVMGGDEISKLMDKIKTLKEQKH